MWETNIYRRMLKVHQAQISIIFEASVLLRNFKICLRHGGQVQSYFKCPLPQFQIYINMNWTIKITPLNFVQFLQVQCFDYSFPLSPYLLSSAFSSNLTISI